MPTAEQKMSKSPKVRGLLGRIKRRNRRGLTLLEVAGALGIVAVAGVGFAQMATESQMATKDKATAVRLKEVADAAGAYVRANYPQIVTVAPLDTPIQIGIVNGEISSGGLQDLQTAGFLGSNFQNRNAYNQQHVVQVVKRAPAATGGPERLEVLVNTFGGNKIPDRSLPRVATLVGAEGGYIPQAATAYSAANTTPGNIIGSYGGWRVPTATYAAAGPQAPADGHVAATLGFDGSSILADFLYRFPVPGMPEANRMHTNIDMTGNGLNNVNIITGSGGGNSIDMSVANKVSIQDDLSINRDTSTGRDLSAGRDGSIGRNLTVTGVDGQNSLTLSNGDANIAKGSLNVGQDATLGRDAMIGRDAIVSGQVYSDIFASMSGVNYAVSPTTTTTLSTLNPEFLNTETLLYGSPIGMSIAVPNPNSAQVKQAVAGMSFEDGQRYIKQISAQYDAQVRQKAQNPNSAVRLGELLPRYVPRGLFVVYDDGEVKAYVNGVLATVSSGGRVPYPTYRDPDSLGYVPGCGAGEPQLYLSKMDDSYSQDLNPLVGVTRSTLPVEAQDRSTGALVEGITTTPAVTDVKLGIVNVSSSANVTPGSDAWQVQLVGTTPGLNSAQQPIKRSVLAQTFCHFQFSEGGTYADADRGLTR